MTYVHPTNTRHWPNVDFMLCQSRTRWANIRLILGDVLCLLGMYPCRERPQPVFMELGQCVVYIVGYWYTSKRRLFKILSMLVNTTIKKNQRQTAVTAHCSSKQFNCRVSLHGTSLSPPCVKHSGADRYQWVLSAAITTVSLVAAGTRRNPESAIQTAEYRILIDAPDLTVQRDLFGVFSLKTQVHPDDCAWFWSFFLTASFIIVFSRSTLFCHSSVISLLHSCYVTRQETRDFDPLLF